MAPVSLAPEYRPPRIGPEKYAWGWRKTGEVPDAVGGGRVPLLRDGASNRVIPRDWLPVGRRVAVRGRMDGGPVIIDDSQAGRWGDVIVARTRNPEAEYPIGDEHSIIVSSIHLLDERGNLGGRWVWREQAGDDGRGARAPNDQEDVAAGKDQDAGAAAGPGDAGADVADAEAAPDLSTPLSAARAMARAMAEGDREQYLHCVRADDEHERKVAEAGARLLAASVRLRRAAADAFGAGAADRLMQQVPFGLSEFGRRMLEGLGEAEAAEEGGRATVDLPDGSSIELRKAGKDWKVLPIPTGELEASGQTAAELSESLAAQNDEFSAVMESVADGVEAGKYKTAEQAAEALAGGEADPDAGAEEEE